MSSDATKQEEPDTDLNLNSLNFTNQCAGNTGHKRNTFKPMISVWQYRPVSPALGRLRQKNVKLEVNLGSTVSPKMPPAAL